MEEENDILDGDDSGREYRKLLGRSSFSWGIVCSLASMLDCEGLCPSTRDNCDPLRALPLPLDCVFGILRFTIFHRQSNVFPSAPTFFKPPSPR